MNIVDQQQRRTALDSTRSFCVTAPAGSGKTELLIQRYLTLLARVERPEQVLAITFTRKAAAEMRDRVLEALVSARAGEPCEGAHQLHTRDLAIKALAANEHRQWRLTENISQINIKTIDGYCALLTRQMPVLSDFGGQVEVVENATELYSEAVVELFKVIETDSELSGDLASLMLHFDNNWARLQELLMSMLSRRDQWRSYIGVHHRSDEAESYLLSTVNTVVVDALTSLSQDLSAYREDLVELLGYAAKNLGRTPPAAFPNNEPEALEVWRDIRNLLLTAGKHGSWRARVDKRMGFPAGKGVAQDYKDRLAATIADLRDIDGLLQSLLAVSHLPQMSGHSESWDLVLQLSRILPRLAAELLLVFQRRGQVDHNQVALSALQALGDDDTPTELALRLDYQLEHILVDEFQDTAINQFELVRRLTRGWGEHNYRHPDNPRTLFIVGDGMQSIYGFRDANVGLFLKARSEGFNGVSLAPLALQSNFRSDSGLVNWVNESFALAFPSEEDVSKGQIRFSEAEAVRPDGCEPAVSLQGFYGECAASDEISAVCETVKRGIESEECSSVAVLARTRSHLQGILAGFKARGIRFSAQDIDSLGNSPVIVDLMSLCRALANPADRLAWMALLRAPWCGLTLDDLHVIANATESPAYRSLVSSLADDTALERLSSRGKRAVTHLRFVMGTAELERDRLPLRTWIEQAWLALGGARTAPTVESLADAERFFQLLEHAERDNRGLDILWLQRKLEHLYIQADDPDSKVQVMTLHKAKGLEFDWVIIPSLGKTPRASNKPLLLWDDYSSSDGERGFLLAADDHSSDGDPTLYNWLKVHRAHKERFETTRLLYVGVTRAVARLFLTTTLTYEQKNEDFRNPGSASLLACIWPTFKSQMSARESAAESSILESPESKAALFRLDEASIKRLGGGSGEDIAAGSARGSNIPERSINTSDRHIGTVVHLALEQISRLHRVPDSVSPSDLKRWRVELGRLGFHGQSLDSALVKVERSIARVLGDPTGRWILSPANTQAQSELEVSFVEHNAVVSELVIDRTFVDKDSETRWIVDYKNSEPDEGEALDDFLQRQEQVYSAQLARYKAAIEALYQRPAKCALYFTALGLMHEVLRSDAT